MPSPLGAGGAAAARAPSLLQHLLAGAVRWKGGTHPAKCHSRPPLYPKRRPKTNGRRRKGKTQSGQFHKLKSHKGAMKRFYERSDGTLWHKVAGKNHLMAGASRRRQTRRMIKHRPVITKGIVKKLKRLMPYGAHTFQEKGLYKYRQPLMWDRPEGWTELFYAAKQEDGVEAVKKMMKAQKAAAESAS